MYLHQKDGTCCTLFALCNALRYFGQTTPEPDTPEWEAFIDRIGCRHGNAIHIERTADALGLRRTRIAPEDVALHIPSMLVVYMPTPAGQTAPRHMVLVVGAEGDRLRLVNYRLKGDGPVVEEVPFSQIKMPTMPQIRGAWSLSLAAEAAA